MSILQEPDRPRPDTAKNETVEPRSPLADIIESLDESSDPEDQRAKKAIQESEQRFASFMNHLPGFAWIKNLEGKYIYANKYCQILPVYSNYTDYVGKTDADLWPPDIAAEYCANDREVIETRSGIQRVETLLVNENRHSVLANKFPIFDAQGNVALVAGVAFDITAHLETEQELKHSHTQLRALTAKLQSAREEEARRIAREIHDELGQSLTTLNLDCAFMEKTAAKMRLSAARSELFSRLRAMAKSIEETAKIVHRICGELRPGVLDDLGVVAALECQILEFQARTNIRCTWLAKPQTLQPSPTQAIAVFRICQEILTNVMRHAVASELTIKLCVDGNFFALEVRDNGKGITPDDISNPKSLGLLGMRERAVLVGGTFDIAPRPEGGTLVLLKVPLEAGLPHS